MLLAPPKMTLAPTKRIVGGRRIEGDKDVPKDRLGNCCSVTQ